jgi:hypothetical protein
MRVKRPGSHNNNIKIQMRFKMPSLKAGFIVRPCKGITRNSDIVLAIISPSNEYETEKGLTDLSANNPTRVRNNVKSCP